MSIATRLGVISKAGRLDWIGLRTRRDGPVGIVKQADADPAFGLVGDRYSGKSGKRQVTLIQAEHLPVIESCLGQPVAPEQLRRNLLISGINILAFKNNYFQIGDVVLQATGLCQPCSKMEQVFGLGAINAMRGHGGLTARVIEGGMLRIGDSVTLIPDVLRVK